MIKRNIWLNLPLNLEIHKDNRGVICDIFYNKNINHVAAIDTEPNSVRGNHYHKETTQHILITEGELEYWFCEVSKISLGSQKIIAKKGDLVTTPPYEIHALKINIKNQFIVFSEGLRGGKDYEKDTFRVNNIINI